MRWKPFVTCMQSWLAIRVVQTCSHGALRANIKNCEGGSRSVFSCKTQEEDGCKSSSNVVQQLWRMYTLWRLSCLDSEKCTSPQFVNRIDNDLLLQAKDIYVELRIRSVCNRKFQLVLMLCLLSMRDIVFYVRMKLRKSRLHDANGF